MPLPKTIIKLQFPKVTRIVDATETISITVTPADAKSGRKKNPEECALARACVRSKIADAAIIGIGYSYLIKGDTATRYRTSAGVAREITSFDRTKYFASGMDYKLAKVCPASRLGHEKRRGRPGNHDAQKSREIPVRLHQTSNIRVMRKYGNHVES